MTKRIKSGALPKRLLPFKCRADRDTVCSTFFENMAVRKNWTFWLGDSRRPCWCLRTWPRTSPMLNQNQGRRKRCTGPGNFGEWKACCVGSSARRRARFPGSSCKSPRVVSFPGHIPYCTELFRILNLIHMRKSYLSPFRRVPTGSGTWPVTSLPSRRLARSIA